jgi:beta-ureidopropionase / N-carbamoyl-L-amino-acid hydrolase
MKELHINIGRVESNLRYLATFGLNEAGGIDRTTFTSADLAAREWLRSKLRELDLDVRVDPAANIWARRNGTEENLPALAMGSHIDTVANGGKYDGALGVLLALEVMHALKERGYRTRHPLELISFTAEEPNPFGQSTFGSRAASGKLAKAELEGVRDPNGTLLIDALRAAGGDPDRFDRARIEPNKLTAYLEVHIEQGKRLISQGKPIGIVTAITGIYREELTVIGEANHAGTTLMRERFDALAAASELILALEEVCAAHPADEVVGTVGRLSIAPNAANIIPERAAFTMELRGKTEAEIQEALRAWDERMADIVLRRKVKLVRRTILDQPPVTMDPQVVGALAQVCAKHEVDSLLLGSMAGHDAAHMAKLTRAGMLFVPSIGGKSHCPEEESRPEDIEKAANVLLHAVIALDQALDA